MTAPVLRPLIVGKHSCQDETDRKSRLLSDFTSELKYKNKYNLTARKRKLTTKSQSEINTTRQQPNLGMSRVIQLRVPRLLEHVVDHGGQVVLCHVLPGEVPKLAAFRIQRAVAARVQVAADVTQPHIVACGGRRRAGLG